MIDKLEVGLNPTEVSRLGPLLCENLNAFVAMSWQYGELVTDRTKIERIPST